MSECAFLFHIDTDSDPSRANDNTPSMSSSAISPLVRCILSLWSCNSTFVYTTSADNDSVVGLFDMMTGLYLSDFHWGSEFRLATSDYSGHGGCQIGTVE